jgi:hypothetical protein
MSTETKIERIGAYFARIPQIKFAYVFGSGARGETMAPPAILMSQCFLTAGCHLLPFVFV